MRVIALILLGCLTAAAQGLSFRDIIMSTDVEVYDYVRRITDAGGTIQTSDVDALKTFVRSAKTHGYWGNLLEVGPFSGDSLTAALIKLKAYTGLSRTLTNTGFVSGDYNRTNGLTGAVNKWLDTGFNPSAYGSKNTGIGFFINDEFIPTSSDNYIPIGQSGAVIPLEAFSVQGTVVAMTFSFFSGGGGSSTPLFSSTSGTHVYGVGKGFLYGKRSSDTLAKSFFNGNLGTTYTGTENAAPKTNTFAVFAGRNGSGAQNFFAKTGSFYSIDDGTISDARCTLFAQDVLALQRALGRVVTPQETRLASFLIGQSLAVGNHGTNTLSTTNVYKLRSTSSTLASGITNLAVYNLVPYRESDTETPGYGFARLISSTWRLAHTNDTTQDLILYDDGLSGAAYSGLKKGGTNFAYTWSMQNLTNLNSIISDYGTNLVVPGLICVHGESDAASSTYSADIAQWQSDYQGDIQAVTGQTNMVPMFHTQISSWTATGYPGGGTTTSTSPYQVLSRYKLDPTKTILVGPKYVFPYYSGDGIHMINTSYRWLGEYYAKAWYNVVVLGGTWSPLYYTNISRTSSNIDLTYSGNVGTLVLDTTLVSDPGNYGFEYTDESSPPAIASVTITATNVVRVQLAATPTGTNRFIRYAYTGVIGNSGGPTTGPRGNLRDSDTNFISNYTNTLYNWAVHQSEVCP